VLVWNDLAGGDGDYCAILVAFNSLLQMVLYAPFAIFYINVVRPPSQPSESITVSYSVVARSVAVFLGNRMVSEHSLILGVGIPLAGAITKLHRLDCPTFTHGLVIYNHYPLCVTREKCRQSDCLSCPSRGSSYLLFRHHFHVYPLYLSKMQV